MKVVVELQMLESGRARDVHASTMGPGVVAFVRVVLWMCIALLSLVEIIVGASAMEPAASDVNRAVACPASSSMRAASSAY